MTTIKQSTEFTLGLNLAERAELLNLLERELRETHMEARRTEAPAYRDEVHHQEAVLQGLLEKVRDA
jgi:hypothetical protein